MVYWLDRTDITQFPDPSFANSDGLLAVGGNLSPTTIIAAYQQGVFPWFTRYHYIHWFSPDPRMVLFPNDLKISKSMRPYFNQQKFRVTFDTDFAAVIAACATQKRPEQQGTWLNKTFQKAYLQLHHEGYAHSVEVWQDATLVGGLYGVALGKCFFGESMFARVSNASKFGFISLVQYLTQKNYWLIDCQVTTDHLESMGAVNIDRELYLRLLYKNQQETTETDKWTIV
ncbi:MAG: leucyl/phenylalanyl-tRNA--protein transferase [Chitinophagales bacterium]|jgi:leucyl/phenylalanyl-tRNA--protein transferase|nr:leucyl/phenylalanyl-tRNA--protein transferase [Chitinophagales bacterium]HNI44325.1 leucyl/phenylalanyl-tRNA--protein transferase [Chitinophagales bacterium]